MSLINEMLRDLEARRAGELAKPDLQREIRPLPERRPDTPRLLPWLALAAAVALAGGGLTWWQIEAGRTQRPAEPTPPASAPLPDPSATPATAAPLAPAAPTETNPAAVTEALRLATSLETPPAESEPAHSATAPTPPIGAAAAGQSDSAPSKADPALAKSVPLPPKAEPAPAKAEPSPAKAEASAAKPKAAEAAPSPTRIEKTSVLATPRERADNEYRRAQALLAGGQAGAAHDALLAALKQDAAYAPARQALLRLLLENRRVDEAMAVLQEGLDLQPSQIAWAMSLARLTVERGDAAGAERILARSAAAAAGNAEYAGFHGHLLIRLGQFRAAAEQYQAATRLAPTDGRWWFGLGQALEGDGHGAEARDAFRRALAAGNLNADLTALAEQKAR